MAVYARCWVSDSAKGYFWFSAPFKASTSLWTHALCTFDAVAKSLNLYINGVLAWLSISAHPAGVMDCPFL